jgi:hypothetical protein
MHLTNFVKQTLGNRLKYVMNFIENVRCRINIGKVYFLKTGMCLRDLHVMVTTISFVQINFSILMPRKRIVCVNIAMNRVISII